FLADAHLQSKEDTNYNHLLSFFNLIKGDVDHLFIVGDFFDFWFCREEIIYPDFKAIIDKLIDLKDSGVSIHLCEGNHDFFLGKFFTGIHGMEVFPEWGTANLDGIRTLVSHGDTIDTTNTRYLMLRKILRSRAFYKIQERIPLRLLWKIARMGSKVSNEHLAKPPDGLVEKMEAFTVEKFKEGFDAVILGHCHTPTMKQYVIDGKEKTFVTLGDWISHYSYLLYEDGSFTLDFYRP
ncbi:MAG: UDP-2,3-diacylglucosamine diphosphatase, partial [Proteobacteria bacterium]|nr:UDP-2,3-diacylglucosamine diphosphatase [Pseudomonadota bacterium]